MLLLEAREDTIVEDGVDLTTPENTFYILILPVLDGNFRASLQGTSMNELQVCVESGLCSSPWICHFLFYWTFMSRFLLQSC